MVDKVFTIHGYPSSIVSDRDSKFTSRFWQQTMKNLQVNLMMATAYHHQTNGQTERRIRTIRQYLRNFTNPRGTDWVKHLAHVQLAINAAPGDSTKHSPFRIVYGRDPRLLPAVKATASHVPSADEYATNLATIQQEARKALERARARQAMTSRSHFSPAPPLVPGTDEVTIRSKPYLKSVGKVKQVGPWLGPFDILEGPDENGNYKLDFDGAMSDVHPWIARDQLRLYHAPSDNMFPSERYTRPGPIQIDGEERWVVEKIVNDRKRKRNIGFLVHWDGCKGGDKMKVYIMAQDSGYTSGENMMKKVIHQEGGNQKNSVQ